jgi:GTP-binding protein
MEINSSFYFVDLPGYGYANVPLAVRKKWQPLIEGYLAQRTTLRLLVLLADIRREPQEDEELFVAWLKQLDIPLLVVLTKIDKVKKNSQVTSLRQWQKRLDIDEKIVLFSAVTGEGKEKIWRYLDLSLRTVK